MFKLTNEICYIHISLVISNFKFKYLYKIRIISRYFLQSNVVHCIISYIKHIMLQFIKYVTSSDELVISLRSPGSIVCSLRRPKSSIRPRNTDMILMKMPLKVFNRALNSNLNHSLEENIKKHYTLLYWKPTTLSTCNSFPFAIVNLSPKLLVR